MSETKQNAQEWLEALKQLNEAATPRPWEYSIFSKPDGSPIETIEDVAETTAHSARYGPRAELFGICTPEKDEDGRNKVIGYTGNGPTSDLNAYLIVEMRNNLSALLDASHVSAEKDAKIAELRQENERQNVQLAGCSVAANGGTDNPAKEGDYGWSVAYQDVLDLRRKHEAAEAKNKELEAALREFRQTRGVHDGEHDASLTVCSKCNESYVSAEAKLDALIEGVK